MERLDNPEDLTARAAIKEMGSNALPDLMQSLRQLQPSADESRGRALTAITCLGPAGNPALPDILPLVTNQNRQLQIRAFFALESIGPETQLVKSVVPDLMKALGDPDWTMRLAALNALAALRPPPPENAPAFFKLLDDPDGMVRDAAMHSLVAQTNPIVIPVLDKQLHDKDTCVVTVAASEIAAFGATAATSAPRLRELLNHPLLTVRQAAGDALTAITGQSPSHSTPEVKAELSFNFRGGMPLEQYLVMYEDWAGKKVRISAAIKPGQVLRLITVHPLTKNEAMQLFEEVLKEQAGLVIVHGADGSLTMVPWDDKIR